MVTERGQIHSLEAVIAALLIVGGLLFASQATAVTPLSASTSNQHIENQQQTMANDLLAITAANGTLQEALLYWNVSESAFIDANAELGHYSGSPPPGHPLHDAFSQTFEGGLYAYNIELRTVDERGGFDSTQLIHMGTPSDNAVTATTTVTLYNFDTIDGDGPRLDEMDGESEFWTDPHSNETASVYTTVEVRMTIWRM